MILMRSPKSQRLKTIRENIHKIIIIIINRIMVIILLNK